MLFLVQDAGVHALSNVCHVDVERISKRKPGEVVCDYQSALCTSTFFIECFPTFHIRILLLYGRNLLFVYCYNLFLWFDLSCKSAYNFVGKYSSFKFIAIL